MPEDLEQTKRTLEVKIYQIQKSTRTLFNIFGPAHNWCRQKSRWYYNWHLNPIRPAAHLGVISLVVMGAVIFFTSYLSTDASSPSAGVQNKTSPPKEVVLNSKMEDLISQTAKLSTNATLKVAVKRLSGTNKALRQISQKMSRDLSSEETQQQIKTQISNILAKEETLTGISEKIGAVPNSSVVDQLAQLLAKASTEATLQALKTELESGLNLQGGLLESVNDRIGDLTDPASGSANDLLRQLKGQLESQLSVSITNWVDSIKVSNLPSEFPDPNVSRSQEKIGSDYFSRGEDFSVWAARQNYLQSAYSGTIKNPVSGSATALTLKTPAGHTHYLLGVSVSTKNTDTTQIVVTRSDGTEIDRIMQGTGTFSVSYPAPIKLKAGEGYSWEIKSSAGATGNTTVSVYYADLPWEE